MITPLGCVLFTELMRRKKEEARLERKAKLAGAVLLALATLLIVDLFFIRTGDIASLSGLMRMVRDPFIIVLALLVVAVLTIYRHYQHGADDAGDDLDDLRAEVIDRSWEMWPKELAQESRNQVMEKLLKEGGINLYYK